MRPWCNLWLALALLGLPRHSAAVGQLEAEVLVLLPNTVLAPFSQGFASVLSETLSRTAPGVRLHIEALPSDLRAGQSQRWLAQRMVGRSLGVMLGPSLNPTIEARAWLRSQIPLVIADSTCGEAAPVRGATGVSQVCVADTTLPTLNLALALLPQTRHVALVGLRSGVDPLRPGLANALAAHRSQVDVIDLGGRTLDELRQAVSSLPPDTVIFLGGPDIDAQGRFVYPRSMLNGLRPVSTAPIFSDISAAFGRGVVGGALFDADALGHAAADMVLHRLRGDVVPSTQVLPVNARVDWRELDRLRLDDKSLPEDVEVVFQEASAWQRYRWQLVLIALVLFAQSALVLGLMQERRRRRSAEVQAHRRLSELAHLNRLGTVSQLSLSLAHEINQPLGTILSSAQTCEVLLDQPQPPLHELRSLLTRIVEADALASGIVRNLRGLAQRHPPERANIKVDTWVRDTVALLAPDARLRGVNCVLDLQAPAAHVNGDRAQLQQVLINLMLNAMEAMQLPGTAAKRLGLSTRHLDGHRLNLRIEDGGPGLPPLAPESVFAPFYSTKQQGLGLGLGIARELVHAHGGELHACHIPGGGARFELTLPLLQDWPIQANS